MKIALKNIKVSDLVAGYYEDKAENSVRGYGGRLNIRPAYQREFIYKDKQRNEVVHTVRKNFPLNTMYWAMAAGNRFEMMDGQQRTISICQYVQGDFPVEIDGKSLFFSNLTVDRQQTILDHELSIYVCEGTEDERLDWFKVINIAGVKLADQELRNAIYTGPWLADAKRWFSRSGCPAYQIGDKYINGTPIRQDFLEKSLEWFSNGKIEDYMGRRQHDTDAQELWQYFEKVIAWVEVTFPMYRKIMKGLNWGSFYNEYKDKFGILDAKTLEERIKELIDDDEVDNKKGIYEYLLTGNEKTLNLRVFNEKTKVMVYEKQNGICPVCEKHFESGEMEADHITPWHQGGKTTAENCQMLCKPDNRRKSGK